MFASWIQQLNHSCRKVMKKINLLIPALLTTFISLSSCNKTATVVNEYNENPFDAPITFKTISKEEYFNKTLGGLLGQFAGFFSGYEFVGKYSFKEYAYGGLPLDWFDFCNGPYAGNVPNKAGFIPPGWDNKTLKDKRLRVVNGIPEVWSDDDYHLDIFNQLIIKEYGTTSYDLKQAWKDYQVSDWGGGAEAIKLIFGYDMLAPFSGTLEAENYFSWCTESYIETETLGFNAAGMPLVAEQLVDKFGSNVGYQDSLIWGKFYATLYALAYFNDDIYDIMEEAKKVFPKGSFPYQFYNMAFDAYELFPNDHASAAQYCAVQGKNIYKMDDRMTDCNVNGAFAILAFLYGEGDYLETCKYASCMGFDGDCTAAICCGVMGIINGFKPENEEYNTINEKIYMNGNGLYVNNQLYNHPPRIRSLDYPEKQRIYDIAKLYQENFEKILLENGGSVFENTYKVPTTHLYDDRSFLFDNFNAEMIDDDDNPLTIGFNVTGGYLENSYVTDNEIAQSGDGTFVLSNVSNACVYHTYTGLVPGHHYRLSTYITNSEDSQTEIFATGGGHTISVTSASQEEMVNKELIFMAYDSSMNIGIRFNHAAINEDECVTFDNFQLEEIERIAYTDTQNVAEKSFNESFHKVMNLPKGVKVGEEVILSIEYDNPNGHKIYSKLQRNGKTYGGIVFSMTSLKNGQGHGVMEIPYVFESEQDVLSILFPDCNVKFGNSRIYKVSSYMFR